MQQEDPTPLQGQNFIPHEWRQRDEVHVATAIETPLKYGVTSKKKQTKV